MFSITTIHTWLNCGTPLGALQSSEALSQVNPARQVSHPVVPLELLEAPVVVASPLDEVLVAAPIEDDVAVDPLAPVAAPLDEVLVAAPIEDEVAVDPLAPWEAPVVVAPTLLVALALSPDELGWLVVVLAAPEELADVVGAKPTQVMSVG